MPNEHTNSTPTIQEIESMSADMRGVSSQPTKTKKPAPVSKPITASTAKRQVVLQVYRDKGNTYLEFEIAESLEVLFKEKSGGNTKTSESWKGLEFYYSPEITDSREYQQLLSQYGLFDDYGHAFVRDSSYFNIAFLRTKGGKGKIKLNSDIPFASVAVGLQNMDKFLRKFYQDFLTDYKVKAILEFEI